MRQESRHQIPALLYAIMWRSTCCSGGQAEASTVQTGMSFLEISSRSMMPCSGTAELLSTGLMFYHGYCQYKASCSREEASIKAGCPSSQAWHHALKPTCQGSRHMGGPHLHTHTAVALSSWKPCPQPATYGKMQCANVSIYNAVTIDLIAATLFPR